MQTSGGAAGAAIADALAPTRATGHEHLLPFVLAIAAYNLALNPRVYGLLARLPALDLGATRYHELIEVTALTHNRVQRIAPNFRRQTRRGRERERWIHELVLPHCPPGTIDLPARHAARAHRLLRYPLLLPTGAQRDALFAALDAAGLGASRMYERVLPEVAGVPPGVDCPELPNARRFAARLLTLPVHAGVTRADAQRMGTITAKITAKIAAHLS